MIITPLDILLRYLRDYFGYPEEYLVPIKPIRMVMYASLVFVVMAVLLVPVIWIMFFSGRIGNARSSMELFIGLIYLGVGLFLMRRKDKEPAKMKLRGWLSGKGNVSWIIKGG